MKWIKIILMALCFLNPSEHFSQVVNVRTLVPSKTEVKRPKYDTTFIYLDLSKLEDNLHYYDNQKILFSPCIDTIRFYKYYSGLFTRDSVEMVNIPDTVWLKKRKGKVREGDFYIKYPKTNVYMPTFVNNDYVCDLGTYYKLKKGQGFYTPFEHVEGRLFTVIGVKKKSEKKYTLHLLDDKDVLVDFDYTASSDNYPSILMMSYINKYRDTYVNNRFHTKEDSYIFLFKDIETGKYFPANGDLVCHDACLIKGGYATIAKIGENYVNLYKTDLAIFFRDTANREFCLPSENKTLGYFRMQPDEELCEGFNLELGKSYYHLQLKDLIPSSEYYAQKEKERIEEEQRIAKNKAEKADRRVYLINKYGKVNAELILRGHVKIGMTAEMCREAWGNPYKVNRSTGIWGVHEQWCYKWGGYLYLENGILTSIQN